eukprot:EG_transcript_8470
MAPSTQTVKNDLVVDSDEDDVEQEPQRRNNMLFHVTRPSLLSSEASKSTYRGLMNIGMLAAVLINLKQFFDLSQQLFQWCTDFWANTLFTLFQQPWKWPMLMLFFGLNIFIVGAYLAEKLAVVGIKIPLSGRTGGPDVIRHARSTNEGAVLRIHTALLALELVLPCIVVLLTNPDPALAAPVVMSYLMWFLKNVSYVTLNYQHRCSYIDAHVRYILNIEEKRSADNLDEAGHKGLTNAIQRKAEMISSGVLPRYPSNISLWDIYYFAFSPTLCYDLNFPRSRRIRVKWILRRTFEFLLSVASMYLVIQRRMLPFVCDLRPSFSNQTELLAFAETWTQVLMFNLLVWLMGFYAFFHLFLNILGELLKFGDRLFYMDFWNATSIDHFWRTWSIPGYRWMLRHIYGPLLKSGYSRTQASVVVFIVSSMMHEYSLGIIFQQLRFFAFTVVALQVPIAIMTQRYVKGTQMGNLIFWLNMVFGPHCFCTLLYSLDFLWGRTVCQGHS